MELALETKVPATFFELGVNQYVAAVLVPQSDTRQVTG